MRATRRALSLVETVVSLTVATTVLVGIGAAITVAARSMPAEHEPATATVRTTAALDQLRDDLLYATAVLDRSATMIDVRIPTRSESASGFDRVRYEWAGLPPTRLDRIVITDSGTTTQRLVDDVSSFAVDLTVDSATTESLVTQTTQSPERLLASWLGPGIVSALSETSQPVSSSIWFSRYFTIDAPANTSRVRFTRLRLRLQRLSLTGFVTISLHRQTGGSWLDGPDQTALGTPIVTAAGLLPVVASWQTVTFLDDAFINDPATELAFQVRGSGGTAGSVVIFTWSSAAGAPAGDSWRSNNADTDWEPVRSGFVRGEAAFELYGTVETTATSAVTRTTRSLRTARIVLRTGAGAGLTLSTTIAPVNKPEMLCP